MSDSHRETVELGPVGPASLLNSIDPRLLVVISRAIMAQSAPVVAFLILEGPGLAGGTVEPVSFCNILFIGNPCAAMVVWAHFGFRPIVRDLNALETRTKLLLLLMGASAARRPEKGPGQGSDVAMSTRDHPYPQVTPMGRFFEFLAVFCNTMSARPDRVAPCSRRFAAARQAPLNPVFVEPYSNQPGRPPRR
ncbi:MAG: hypothetical protein ACR2PO_18155 [Methyloligellaceae bacterium]